MRSLRRPAPRGTPSRLLLLAALLAPTAALSGCLLPLVALDPMDIDVEFGDLHIERVDVEPEYALLPSQVSARVEGELRAANAREVTATLFLVAGPCPMGPAGEPESWLDRETRAWSGGPHDGRLAFEADLSSEWAWEVRHHVVVVAEAENSIGPIFGECHEFDAWGSR